MEKAKLPENGHENTDLLDCLLQQRSQEVDSEIICEFEFLMFVSHKLQANCGLLGIPGHSPASFTLTMPKLYELIYYVRINSH